MAAYLDPKTGNTIGYQETKGTTAEPFQVAMAWSASALAYVSLGVDASGNLLTAGGGGGGGGGIQYANGTTQATPTGTVAMGKDASNILKAVSLDGSGNLNVNLAAGSISGGNAAASPTGAAVPASADYIGFNSGGDLVGVSTANPLPVSQQGSVAVTGTFWQATQPVSLSTLPSLATGANTIGAVNVNGTVSVSGTFFQATQPVSIAASVAVTGPLTDTQLRASAVPVSLTSTTVTNTVATSDSHTTAAAPLSVRLSDGAAFYTATGGGGGGNLATSAKGTTAAGSPTSENTDANTQSLHTKIVNTSIPVTGTFFQATQPISAAALPLPTGASTETTLAALNGKFSALGQGTMAASTPVVIASNQSAVPVSGTFFQTTQPVSIATLPALATGANVIGAVTQSGTWNIGSITTLPALPAGTNTIGTTLQPGSTLFVTGTAATGVALTVTLPAVAAVRHYITSLEITAYSTAARTGGATPVIVTTTNLPGSPAYTFATAAAIGTTDRYMLAPTTAIVSTTVNTATTVVCPLTTGVIWRVNVSYYTGA